MTVVIFIIVLGILIFVHELGHFIFARLNKIRVDAFKLGFGPKIISWTRGETEYGVNLLPLGGYVKIFGEDPNDENTNGPDKARSFVHKHRLQQAIVLVGGVLFNFLFAWLLYTIVFASGVTADPGSFPQFSNLFHNPRVLIAYVADNSPAKTAGIKPGDTLTEISVPSAHIDLTQASSTLTATSIPDAINSSQGKTVYMSYTRGAESATATVTPNTTIIPGKYAMGVQLADAVSFKLPILTSIDVSLNYTLVTIRDTAVGLYTFVTGIFNGTSQLSQVSGPVGIAADVGDVLQLGFNSLLMFTALISINLGVINIIPFPALDGGRLLFVIIEGVTRKRIPTKFANSLNAIGFILLMILIIAVTYNDIANLIQ